MRYDSDLSYEVPTLGNWWDVIRQYRDRSNFPVTDTVSVGPECSYTGPHVNLTLSQVTEIGKAAFNRTSVDGFGSLTCNQFFHVDENSFYHVLFSNTVTFLEGTEQRKFTDMCSGNFPVEVTKDQPVSVLWARAPMEADDQCSVLLHGSLYKGPPNGNEKVDSLVGNLLGKIAEEVTNQDGRGWTSSDGNGFSVSSLCTSQFEMRSTGPPLYVDINGSFSFNAIGLNGRRYILPYIWDQNIRNCALKLSEACTTNLVILKQPSSYMRVGVGVNRSDGLQPYLPNQQCKWKIDIPKAKFLSFNVHYFSIAPDSDDLLQVCPSDSSDHDGCTVISTATKDLFTKFKLMGSEAYVKFVSGDSVSFESRGWELKYTAGLCSGNEDIYNSYGLIGYDTSNGMSYVRGLNCRWLLHGKPGTGVSLTFTRINISKDLDFIAIFSSTSREIVNFTGSYNGSNLPQVNLTGKVTIMFNTQTEEGDGWSANYYLSSPGKPSNRALLFVLVFVLVAMAVSFSIGVVVLALLQRRRGRKRNLTPLDPNESFVLVGSDFLREENRIGQGHSAVVYRAVLADGRSVAVKSLKDTESRMEPEEEILLKSSSHPNIVSLLGSSRDELPGRSMVFELMGRGSLSYNLRKKGETLSWEQRLEIALQISSAIQMLHMYMKPPVFHGNITSDNILLDEFCNAKLGGFGSARYCNAVEITDGEEDTSETAEDMWSFGILLLELLAGEPLLNRNDYRNFGSLKEMNEIMGDQEFVDQRLGLPSDDCKIVALTKFGDIAKWCVSGILRVDDENPKIGDVVSGLQQVKQLFHSASR
ncbi:receptor-like protein kinase 7 isoform X2 [Punica granatum]|nr:receptor-like protein kinase 7 isoform X2 [Punica granatum]